MSDWNIVLVVACSTLIVLAWMWKNSNEKKK